MNWKKWLLMQLLAIAVMNVSAQLNQMKRETMDTNNSVSIRYIVNNVDSCLKFYQEILEFEVVTHPAPGFAMLSKGNLRLLLNQPGAGGAGAKMPDGEMPQPGGWNRFQLPAKNLEKMIEDLKRRGAKFRNELVKGIGGKQILLEDPSGNLIELFESN